MRKCMHGTLFMFRAAPKIKENIIKKIKIKRNKEK